MISLERNFIMYGALLLSCIVGITIFGMHERTVGRDQYIAAMQKVQVKYTADTKKVTSEKVTEYVDRIVVVKEKGDTIIKKVPVYVTVKDDSACTVNTGFVRLWNSANQMSFPGTPRADDEKPSQVVLSDIASQHIKESGICTRTEVQLESLQGWIRAQQSLSR